MDKNSERSVDLPANDTGAQHHSDSKESIDIYEDIVDSVPLHGPLNNSPVNATSEANEDNTTIETRSDMVQPVQPLPVIAPKYQLYVGNLTWWTSDQHILDAISDLGVHDCTEVKFFENRINGQSKGFCMITLGTGNSARACLEGLSTKTIFGRRLVVTYPTRQALCMLESQSRTRPITNRQSCGPLPFFNGMNMYPTQPMSVNYNSPSLPPFMMVPPPPPMIYSARPPFFNGSTQSESHEWARQTYRPLPSVAYTENTNSYEYSRGGISMQPDTEAVPEFNQPRIPGASPGQESLNGNSLSMVPDWVQLSNEEVSNVTALYEKIMYNNQIICRTAISRAFSETAAGDYNSAIDTLRTALSLIEESQTADDDRYQIVIGTLRDTLFSVELEATERSELRARERNRESQQR